MAEAQTHNHAPRFGWVDPVWVALAASPFLIWAIWPDQVGEILGDAAASLWGTAPFILFAIFAIGYLKATGAETLLARAFTGPAWRMIVVGAAAGGLAPFCSCEVIPFIAALLAAGAPLGAVMAFWLSSPLMDPAMFAVTAGALGLPFAIAKTVAAVGLGMFGGFAVHFAARAGAFADPLKAAPVKSCCGSGLPLSGRPVWAFWADADRRATFGRAVLENALFLGKWLAVAYVIEAVMVRHIPAELVAGWLGGEGPGTVALAALVGGPAYLNGYAAVPLIAGLIEQGMSQGAALAFVLAGGVSCIPAAVAVWALVKPRVFLSYLALAFVGSVIAGLAWGVVA